jgi:hypothetical protein
MMKLTGTPQTIDQNVSARTSGLPMQIEAIVSCDGMTMRSWGMTGFVMMTKLHFASSNEHIELALRIMTNSAWNTQAHVMDPTFPT